jgi:predicted glycosyltransferase
VASYVFTSHDGFGLGHVRRNVVIAAALLRRDPWARVTVVTGVADQLAWLRHPALDVVRVPPLVKGSDGRYRHATLDVPTALARRSELFDDAIAARHPDVVVVDRHPYGVGGELRPGLARARQLGAAVVLGLRDILDDARVIRAELAGEGWVGAARTIDRVLVYGAAHVCDHEAEYGLPMHPTYIGWVTDASPTSPSAARAAGSNGRLLVVASGGGADGARVRRVGIELVRANPGWHAVLVAGPHAPDEHLDLRGLLDRVEVRRSIDDCRPLLRSAGAAVQMAGYNTTVEALAAGLRPMLVPRRVPRREQAIRAARLASLGVADVVDDAAGSADISWLLQRPRSLRPDDLAEAGIELDGAERAAELIQAMAAASRRRLMLAGAR